jgi:ribosomal protein S21
MALETRKKERETSQSLIRRFSKSIRGSGILLRARKVRFRERPKSRLKKKEAALRREELRKQYEKLKKLGKIEE